MRCSAIPDAFVIFSSVMFSGVYLGSIATVFLHVICFFLLAVYDKTSIKMIDLAKNWSSHSFNNFYFICKRTIIEISQITNHPHTHIFLHIYNYQHISIYIERERQRARERQRKRIIIFTRGVFQTVYDNYIFYFVRSVTYLKRREPLSLGQLCYMKLRSTKFDCHGVTFSLNRELGSLWRISNSFNY